MSLRAVIKSSAIGSVIWPFLHDEKAKYYQKKPIENVEKPVVKLKMPVPTFLIYSSAEYVKHQIWEIWLKRIVPTNG